MENLNAQSNIYNVIYSSGKASDIYVTASNIKEAYEEAKKLGINSSYWKLKRCYNGGVRG